MMRTYKKPNVVGGGMAIPLGNDFYYMQGRKHSQGGIDIGKNPKTGIEVEGGEVMHMGDKMTKIYSAQPIIGGYSPANLVLAGADPNKVFRMQERFKRVNGVNDDGTKRKRADTGTKIRTDADMYVDNNGNAFAVKDGKIIGNNAAYQLNAADVTPTNTGTSLTGLRAADAMAELKAAQNRRYALDHPLETMQRNSEMMTKKYGVDWRDNSPYGMNPDMNTFNAVTGGVLNLLSPSQLIGNVRNVYRILNGTGSYDDFVNGYFFGNNGVVWSDEWAKEHPYLTMGANMLADAVVLGGVGTKGKPTKKFPIKTKNAGKSVDNVSESWTNSEPLTSAKWDIEYNKAVQAGNMNKVQAIRDAHYLRSVPHTEITVDRTGKPITWYHGTEYGGHSVFNSGVSNATIGGASAKGVKGNFLTTDLNAAQNYAHGTNFVDPAMMHTYSNKYVTDLMNISNPQYRKMYEEYKSLITAGKTKKANKLYADFMKQHPTAGENILQKNVVYPLYVNPQKTATYDFKGNPWSAYPEELPTQYFTKRQFDEVTPTGVISREQDSPLTFDLSEAKKIMEDSGFSMPITMYGRNGKSSIFGVGKPYDRSATVPADRYGVFEEKYPHTTNGVVQYSANQGYDSISMRNVVDANPHFTENYPIDELVPLNSNQMKLTSPITYDDNGNIIPISKRDDWTNPDVRYEKGTASSSSDDYFEDAFNFIDWIAHPFRNYRTSDPLNNSTGIYLSPSLSQNIDRFVPSFLKAPKISDADIADAVSTGKSMYKQLPEKFSVIGKLEGDNQSTVHFLSTHDFAKKFPKSKDAVGVHDPTEGIFIKKPTVVWPWQRSLYRKNTLGNIAHEAGHSQQVKDYAPDIVDYGKGLYYKYKGYNIPYKDPDNPRVFIRPATAIDDTISDYGFANYHVNDSPMWDGVKVGKWEGSPNELLSEVDKLRYLGYVDSKGNINKTGMASLAKRFNVTEKAISDGLKRLQDNYEYTPYQYKTEVIPNYADRFKDWAALNGLNVIRDAALTGLVGGSAYFVGKKLKEKNE